jgi:hypothetical protein
LAAWVSARFLGEEWRVKTGWVFLQMDSFRFGQLDEFESETGEIVDGEA